MTTIAVTPVDAARAASPPLQWWRRPLRVLLLCAAIVGLFFAYWAMSRTEPMNADGASVALEARDLLHGNVLLSGWITNVPFFTNELLVMAVTQWLHGFNADVAHICAAVEYTLLAVLVAALARGRSRGREAVVRVGLALAVMLVPQHDIGVSALLTSPDHAGTAVLLLLPLLVLDRWPERRWVPYAVGALLLLGQLSDPLVRYVAVLPLILVSALRWWRLRRVRELWLGLAALASAVVSWLVLDEIQQASGLYLQAVKPVLTTPSGFGHNLWITVECLAADFGAYFPQRHGLLDIGIGIVSAALLILTLAVAARSIVERHLVDQLLAVGIAANLGAFVISTIPADVGSARQIAPTLFLGAALVGRVIGPRLAPRLPRSLWRAVLAGLTVVAIGGEFVAQTLAPPVPSEDAAAAAYLEEHHLTYGLAGYWAANNITLQTGGSVQAVPVWGERAVYAFRWLSKKTWYDPSQHDARFVVIDTRYPAYGTEDGTRAQFGDPAQRVQIAPTEIIYIYDRNLLVGLPAWCPGIATSMADCR